MALHTKIFTLKVRGKPWWKLINLFTNTFYKNNPHHDNPAKSEHKVKETRLC